MLKEIKRFIEERKKRKDLEKELAYWETVDKIEKMKNEPDEFANRVKRLCATAKRLTDDYTRES